MKKVLLWLIILVVDFSCAAKSQTVSLSYDTSSVQAKYAVKMLVKSLVKQGYQIMERTSRLFHSFNNRVQHLIR